MPPNRFNFRVWNPVTRQMFTPYLMFADIAAGRTEYVLMQSTGLADMDGQEIFEGDFVRGIQVAGIACIRMVFRVEWDGRALVWTPLYTWDSALTYPANNVTEVIGNIYANPELATWRKET